MSQTQRTVNTFQKGRRRNIDAAQMSQQSYLDSVNGRIIFNEDGTYAWENAKGTKFAFNLSADYGNATDYKPIGSGYISGKLIVFSTNETNSEIGIVTQPQFDNFEYKTLFNDKYDPNGDLLAFSLKHNIRVSGVQENNLTEGAYFNDDFNEPRVFNLLAGQTFNWAPPYPAWYSVHGIAQMPDMTGALMKYVRTIGGQLLSGKYQYAYRLIQRTGYASPWSPLTRGITVSSKQVSASDWNQYDMGASNVVTNKGIELEVKYLDQRFQQIEVAAIYWQTDLAADSAAIVFKGNITGDSISVFHVEQGGEPVTLDEFEERFFAIKKAKAQAISQDNFYHLGNFETYANLEIDTDGITAEPITRRMLSDELGAVDFLPLTNQSPKNTTITKRLMSGAGGSVDEQYVVDNEYINYKGTQFENLFPGYFRKERYPFAIVLFNRKGQPMFAQHITDFTLPSQYGNTCQDVRLSGTTTPAFGAAGDYVLTNYDPGSTYQITDTIQQGNNIVPQLLGMKFGNIDLTDILFDADGKLQVSGFMIVRMDRYVSVVGQGLLLNTIRNSTELCNYTSETRPLASCFNWLFYSGNPISGPTVGEMQDGCQFSVRGFFHTFECPDFMVDNTLFAQGSTEDRFELTGATVASFQATGFEDYPKQLQGNHGHFYTKNYQTPLTGWDSATNGINPEIGVSHFGDSWRVLNLYADAVDVDNLPGGLFWRRYSGIQNYMFVLDANDDFSAIAHRGTVLVNVDGLGSTSLRYNTGNHIAYYIANYQRPVSIPNISASMLNNRVYNGIGHFVPINATTLAAAFNGTRYIFNDVEVWGGDCYADYFGYARLVPGYFGPNYNEPGDCDYWSNNGRRKPDYAIGLMFPVESKFNLSMRSGVTYPKVGTEPMATYCGDDNVFGEGIYYIGEDNQRPEDFNINRVLQQKDLLGTYESDRDERSEVTDFPVREIYSDQKNYGELLDSWRKFRINNFQDANGAYGEITDMQFVAPFNSIYVLQRAAFARIRFNDRQFVSTEQGNVVTGTGEGYQGHDYLSVEVGCQHQWSVVNSGRAIYWMDAERGKHVRFAQNGIEYLSDMFDAKDIMFKLRDYWIVDDDTGVLTDEQRFYDNPTYLGGVHGVFDYKNNSVVYTFTKRRIIDSGEIEVVGTPFTIEFNEALNEYVDTPTFYPDWYMQMKHGFFSCDNVHAGESHKVYFHDEGVRGQIYGENMNSYLRFAVNVAATEAKVFDNVKLMVSDANGAGIIKRVTINTNIVNSQVVVLNDGTVDSRPVYREGELWYPSMEKGQIQRLRGQYAIFEYEIENTGNDVVTRLTAQTTMYRLSHRV